MTPVTASLKTGARVIAVNEVLRSHPIELVGAELREAMTEMKAIVA
jgi:ketol-acid reductoisomerase